MEVKGLKEIRLKAGPLFERIHLVIDRIKKNRFGFSIKYCMLI